MRTPRFEQISDGCLVHVTTRCYQGEFFLRAPKVKRKYLEFLLHYKQRYGVKIHGYAIMDNHVHVLCRIGRAVAFSRMLQAVHSRFVSWYNDTYNRSYAMFPRRPSTTVIEDDQHCFEAMRYIDLNCWRTKRRIHPDNWEFSSYRFYAHGKADPLIDPNPMYEALAATDEERREAYRDLVTDMMTDDARRNEITKALGPFSHYFGTREYMLIERKKLKDRVNLHKATRLKGRLEWPSAWNTGSFDKE